MTVLALCCRLPRLCFEDLSKRSTHNLWYSLLFSRCIAKEPIRSTQTHLLRAPATLAGTTDSNDIRVWCWRNDECSTVERLYFRFCTKLTEVSFLSEEGPSPSLSPSTFGGGPSRAARFSAFSGVSQLDISWTMIVGRIVAQLCWFLFRDSLWLSNSPFLHFLPFSAPFHPPSVPFCSPKSYSHPCKTDSLYIFVNCSDFITDVTSSGRGRLALHWRRLCALTRKGFRTFRIVAHWNVIIFGEVLSFQRLWGLNEFEVRETVDATH